MKKIMVVDDEELFLFLTKSMLEASYDVVCVHSGEEALSCFDEEKPDLVLADLMMPGINGLELQEAFNEKYIEKVPMVFMTSDDRDETEINTLRGGAMDFIHKPFQKEVLLRRVGNILSNLSQMENLKEEARTDLLTGLLNKSYSEKLLTERCATKRGCLMLLDLDSFKLVNDMNGHDTGDKILVAFSDVLKKVVRNMDIAGRIGGDEFVAFCSNVTSKLIVETKANQIQEMFAAASKEILGEDSPIPIGVSIGVVYVPNEGTEYAELFKKADKALYNVKQNGKHGFAIFNEGAEIAEELKDASIQKTRSVLDERSEPTGAFELGSEGFRDVYRFLKRSVKNYHSVVQYGIFTIELDEDTPETYAGGLKPYTGADDKASEEAPSVELEDIMDRFGVILNHSLRCSDVYTRNGTNQYWLLLPESSTQDCIAVVVARVIDNWKEAFRNDNVHIKYEIEDI